MALQQLDEKRYIVYWDERAHIKGPTVEIYRGANAKACFPEDDGWDPEEVAKVEELEVDGTYDFFNPIGIVAVWRVK